MQRATTSVIDHSAVHLLHQASQHASDTFAKTVGSHHDVTSRQLAVLTAISEEWALIKPKLFTRPVLIDRRWRISSSGCFGKVCWSGGARRTTRAPMRCASAAQAATCWPQLRRWRPKSTRRFLLTLPRTNACVFSQCCRVLLVQLRAQTASRQLNAHIRGDRYMDKYLRGSFDPPCVRLEDHGVAAV